MLTENQKKIIWEVAARFSAEPPKRRGDPPLRLKGEYGTPESEDFLARMEQTIEEHEINVIFPEDPLFPESLKHIPDPPQVLFYKGNPALMHVPSVAVVGTRRCSPYGEQAAYEIARAASQRGLPVISGLAFGIDAAAHRGGLEGGGGSIALLPCGLEMCYPRSHEWLLNQIIKEGLAISEFPPNAQMRKWLFLLRNRLISGLAMGTVVVEAAERSGALNTANHALEQGKDVFAVPGSIFDSRAQGPLGLMSLGAIPVTSTQTVAEYYAPLMEQMTLEEGLPEPLENEMTADDAAITFAEWILRQIHPFGIMAEALMEGARERGKTPEELQRELTSLELNGKIKRGQGGKFFRI